MIKDTAQRRIRKVTDYLRLLLVENLATIIAAINRNFIQESLINLKLFHQSKG